MSEDVKLPELDVTEEERAGIQNMRPMAARNTLLALERLACRERQLSAALTEIKGLRNELAAKDEKIAELCAALCDGVHLTEQLEDAEKKLAELMRRDLEAVTNCDKLRVARATRKHWQERAESAESSLRAVSDIPNAFAEPIRARLRAIVEGK